MTDIKLSPSQQKIINALLEHPEGLLSGQLSALSGVSNKSNECKKNNKMNEFLAEKGLMLCKERLPPQWLWVIKPLVY